MAIKGNISSLNVELLGKIRDDLAVFRNLKFDNILVDSNNDLDISINNICKSSFLGIFACIDSIMELINNSFINFYSLTKDEKVKYGNIENDIIYKSGDKELIDCWHTFNKYRNLRHHIAHENYEPIKKRKNSNDIYDLIKINNSLVIRQFDGFQEVFFKDSQINLMIIDLFENMVKKIINKINDYKMLS